MTESNGGGYGPPSHILDAVQQGNQVAVSPDGNWTLGATSGGFDAGAVWDSHYDLTAAGVEAVGNIPIPSQAKIDNFQRTIAKLFIDLDEASRKEQAARAGAEKTAEQRTAEIEDALKLKHEVMGKFCDALSLVCSNKPTRKQLGGLSEPMLMHFLAFVGGLLNPNV